MWEAIKIKKKTVCISICILLIIAVLPTSGTIVEKSSIPASSLNSQESVLEAEIEPHFGIFAILIHVENIGNQSSSHPSDKYWFLLRKNGI